MEPIHDAARQAGAGSACRRGGLALRTAPPPRRPLHAGIASIALAALAVAAAASAAGYGAPAQDGAPLDAPWAAHAQQPPDPVRIGAFMAPGGGFDDTPRILALRHAVGEFNLQGGGGAMLELAEYNFTRGNESAALEAAYAGGDGPSYYIGPTTSSGLSSIMGYANESGIVLVSPASDAAHLAVPGDTTFRLTISVEKQARALARIMSNASIDAAVTVIRDDAWGRSFNASLSDELGLRGVELAASVPFSDSDADWSAAAAAAGGAAADIAAAQGPPRAGIVFAGFGADYREMAAAVASAGQGDAAAAAGALPWFAPSAAIEGSTLVPIANDTVRAFSTQVNLTALGHNAPPNAVTDRLDAALAPAGSDPERLTYYEYAAYDSLFVLGTAIGMVRDATGGDTPDPAAVAAAMPAAALAHKGALGRIALNPSGDLLMPDAFGVWQVGASGAWNRTGTAASGTPVTEIGMLAILAGGHEANRVAAARLAVNDHNWGQDAAAASPGGEDGRHYLHMSVHNITVNDTPPRVLDVLRDAHAAGNGPSVYVGPSTSGNTKRVLDYANENGVVLVSPSATAPSLSIAGDNLFRLAPDDSQQGLILANVIGRDLSAAGGGGDGAVVVAARDDAWGRDLNRTAAGRLAALGLEIAPVPFSERADWPSVAQRLNAAIDSAASGGGPAAVLFIGLAPDFRGVAPLASDALQWYAPDSIAASRDVAGDAAARGFADRVNLTATLFNAPENAEQDRVRSALAEAGVSGLRTYDYSTYDAVSMLGDAILGAWGSGGDAAAVAAAIPPAAEEYEGALGDIALNSRGDLRSPNDYALWTMEGDAWKRIEVFPGTPVVRFGALVSLDGTPSSDAARLEAMRLAVDEYNLASEAAGGPMYIDLSVVRTSIVPAAATPMSPAAAEALESAYAAGGGPSYYIGPTTSGNAARVLGFANSNNITLISPSSTAASLAKEGDALFRLAPNDALQGRVLADVIHNRQGDIIAGLVRGSGADAVVSLVRNDTWGRDLDGSASARLAAHGIPVDRIPHAPHGANWADIASRLDSAIGSRLDAGSSPAVLHVGFQGDFAAIAEQYAEGGRDRIASVPWYGTDGIARGSAIASNGASLALADATNLTATVFDAPASPRLDAVKAALAARGVASPGPYAYSSYDAVLVMAGAVEMAMDAAGASSYTPADVRGMVRAAAAAHDGALGDIELNRAGDLRTPNGYAAWTIEDGAWERAGAHPPTPVFDVGALLVLGAGQPYSDGAELGVIEAAVDDFNTAHELVGDFYLDVEVRRIRASPGSGSADPGALAGLEAAHAGGAGPSYYIGPSSSANAARMLDYANRNGLVLVSPSSTDPSLAVPADALFRMIPDYTRHADALARLLGERGAAEVVLAVRDDAWGAGVNASLRTALGGLDAPPAVSQVSFAEDSVDWAAAARGIGAAAQSAAARAAASSAPAAVVFAGFDGDFAALAAQAAADPDAARALASAEWLGAGGISAAPATLAAPGVLDLAGAVNLTAVRFAPPATAVAAGLDSAATYGPSAYDSVRVLGAAIAAAYADSPNGTAPWGPAVGEEMQGAAAEYTGALGDLELDENGDLGHPATFGVYTVGASAGGGGTWTLDRIIAPGADGECPADARCIAIGELYTAELGEAAGEIHEAYAMAAEDYNREQAASGASPRAHIVLQRAEVSLFSPLEGLEAAYAGGAGPAAYVGPITSSSALAMKPLIDREGIVLVSPTSASTGGGLADADTLFRLALSDTYEADLLAISAGYEGVETMIPAVRDDAYGLSYGSELRTEGRILGIAVSDPVVMEIDAESPSRGLLDASADAAELNRIASAAVASGTPASAVGIVVAGTTADLHDLAHYAVEYPLLADAKWFEPGNLYPPRPITDAETLELARTAELFSTQWDVPQTGRFTDVHDRLAARVGIEPHMHSYAAYDAVLLLADAVNRSMAADGSYAGPDVAAEVPAAAARLHGLLGDGLVLDAGGDRVSPSSVVLWKTEQGTGRWIDDGRLHLDPTCGIALRSAELAFGDVRPGSPSGAAVQGVRAAGTVPVSGLDVHATPWTSADTGGAVLPSGATQLLVGPDWTPLSGTVDLGGSGGAPLASWRDLSFRVSPDAGTAPATGQIVQSVTYAATCE